MYYLWLDCNALSNDAFVNEALDVLKGSQCSLMLDGNKLKLPRVYGMWMLHYASGEALAYCEAHKCYVLSMIFKYGDSKDLKKQVQYRWVLLDAQRGCLLFESEITYHGCLLLKVIDNVWLCGYYEAPKFGKFHIMPFDPGELPCSGEWVGSRTRGGGIAAAGNCRWLRAFHKPSV
ncbi:hypothetical protein L7F22_002513 [Adiantum nelumboides]|nr:hypothetical protein [Adiantum nelumboides]